MSTDKHLCLRQTAWRREGTPNQKFAMEFSEYFEPKSLQEADLDEVVKQIHLTGYAVSNDFGFEQTHSPTNHWTMFLELDCEKSVKVDINPTYANGKMTGLVFLESKACVMTYRPVKSLTFSLKNELHVKDVMEIIMRNGRDRYIFTDKDEGCRFTVIKDLEVAEAIGKGSAVVAVRTLGCYWGSPTEGTPREMEAGEFF